MTNGGKEYKGAPGAKALGVPLLDKLQLNATTDLVEQYAVSDEHPLATDIEPLVLLALAGRADACVLVVKADESVPFYDPAFAAVLDLPFPPERVTPLRPPRQRGTRASRRWVAVPTRGAATRAGPHRPHPCRGRGLSPRRGRLAMAVYDDLAALLQSRWRTDRGGELRHRRSPPSAANYLVNAGGTGFRWASVLSTDTCDLDLARTSASCRHRPPRAPTALRGGHARAQRDRDLRHKASPFHAPDRRKTGADRS